MMFLFGRYLQAQFNKSASPQMKIAAEYILLIYTLPFLIRCCILFRYVELANFINSFFRFYKGLDVSQATESTAEICNNQKMTMRTAALLVLKRIRSKRPKHQNDDTGLGWPKGKDNVLTFFMTTNWLLRWLDVETGWSYPERGHLLTSLLATPNYITYWQKFLLLLPHVYIWWTTWALINFLLAYSLAYVQGTILAIGFVR